MKIAVTSQNRKTITEHAGKCRKFWVYDITQQQIAGKELLELPLAQSFHESAQTSGPQAAHPLDGITVLLAGSAGQGLKNRLAQKGIQTLVTTETDPDQAVAAWLNGTLALVQTTHECDHDHDGHALHHHHQPD